MPPFFLRDIPVPVSQPTVHMSRSPAPETGRWEYPVREYIGSMAGELARMARADGAESLGDLLDAAAEQAWRTP